MVNYLEWNECMNFLSKFEYVIAVVVVVIIITTIIIIFIK